MTTDAKPACNCTPEGDVARNRRPGLHQEHCAVLRWWNAKERREPALWASCPAFYALPAGLDAVLTACDVTRQPMSTGDRQSLADWLRLELARVDRTTKPLDRQFVAIDRRAMEAILCGLVGPPKPFDHSDRTTKHFEPLLGFCACAHCTNLPEHEQQVERK